MASELKEVRYEAVASDPTAVWQIATVANHKADMVQQQRGDFQKVMTGLQESMNRVEILLQRLANPQARVVEPRNMQDWAQSGKLEMKVTRRIEDLGQVNLNNTQGVHLLGAPEGNFNFPSTGFSVVATGWEQDQWPNDSLRRVEWENPKVPATLDGYRKLVVPVIEEYFSTGDVELAAFELRSLGSDQFHHYFVKKLISMAMDRHDKEREMASVLLSALYADLLSSSKMIEGFMMLLESTEDLAVDIPDAIDVLAVFVVRAVVDEILPPVCLTRARALLPESFKGVEVLRVAEKSYLSAPHHVELVERKWGGSTYFTVEEAKKRIQNILREYIESADDLSLDTPSAVTLFDKLVSIAISEEWRDASLSKSAIPGGTIVGREDKKRSQVVRIWDPGTGSKNMKWRRHVLTKDTVGSVKLWEITRGAVIDDFGKVPSEDKKKELFEMVSIPAWFTMDLSCLLTSSSDDETRALNALLDAFGCAFPLEDIATAYCITKGDVNRAGDFLTDPQLSMPQGNEVDPSVETNLSQMVKADEESYIEYLSQTRMREKLPKSSASFGIVSSMLVKGSARATTLVNRASEKEKPLRVELPEYMRDDFNVETDESNSAPKRETLNNRDVEEFLFSMLGEGFKLSMEVIREVLGCCGYDIKKSMEELMSFSAKDPGKKADNKHNVIRDAATESSFSKGSCVESQSASRNGSACSSQEEKHSSRLQISPGELIESIFTVPERSEEEPKGRRYELGANRSRVPDQKPVLKPLEDISSYSTDLPVKVILGSKEPVVHNEDDYQNYRRAAKQHWDMMKQYYEKAADAFREGNRKEVEYLLGEGKHYYRMARLADEKSAGEIIKSKKRESKNELCLDLRAQDAANVANLLRLHLKQFANIPSFEYLKVIIGIDDGSFKMGQRRRKVMKYLEKKSIQWTEDEANPGTILIRINQLEDQRGSIDAHRWCDTN